MPSEAPGSEGLAPPESEPLSHSSLASRRNRRTRRWVLPAIGALVAAGAAVAALLLLGRGGGISQLLRPQPPSAPPRAVFAFPQPSVKVVAVTSGSFRRPARQTADAIRTTLSRFYDRAFMDPEGWTKPVPPAVWSAFTPAARTKATKDAASFTLFDAAPQTGPQLARLSVKRSRLSVQVLFDQHRKATAAVATVYFAAAGTLKDGDLFVVTDRASFLFRPVSGKWLVAGYPLARLRIASSPPSIPTPSASGAATPSPSIGTP